MSSPRRARSLRSLLAVLAVGSGVLLGSTAPASADDAAIAHVETTDAGLRVLVSVPAGATVDLAGVTATVDGTSAPATARRTGQTSAVRRTAVLAMDTSQSMHGDRFGSAKQAALEFISSVPDDVYVGIVAFAGDVSLPLAPTLDRNAARQVVGNLKLSHGTRLYDGVGAAITAAGTQGQRTIVVLSDGADTSDTSLDSTTSQISTADVLLDVVALSQSDSSLAALSEMADAGHGQVIEAGRTALARAFAEEAKALARQVLVTVQVPAGTSTEGTLSISLPSDTGTITSEVFTTVRDAADTPDAAPVPQAVDPGYSAPGWVMYAGVVALGLGLFAVSMLLVPSRAKAPRSMVDRVTQYTAHQASRSTAGPHAKSDESSMGPAETAMKELLERNRGFEERVSNRLEGAGSELKPPEWLVLHLAIFVGSGLLGLLIGKGNIVVGIVFLAFGAALPWLYLGLKKARRRKAFNAALPEVLQLMSGSLAAGLSLAQSIDTIVREGVEPVAGDFRRVLMETRLGVPLEDALEGVAERFESKDFEWAVMAIRIQRQVGGNLSELLATVAATMREREYVRRQVAALAAEGKLSALVLGGLPPLFLFYLLLTQRSFVMPLFTDPRGWVMLGFGVVWLGVGVFWMSRLIKVEV